MSILSLSPLQGKSREQSQKLYLCFIDLEKTFDSVPVYFAVAVQVVLQRTPKGIRICFRIDLGIFSTWPGLKRILRCRMQ